MATFPCGCDGDPGCDVCEGAGRVARTAAHDEQVACCICDREVFAGTTALPCDVCDWCCADFTACNAARWAQYERDNPVRMLTVEEMESIPF